MANEDLISSNREAMILRHWNRFISGSLLPGAERMEFYDLVLEIMMKIVPGEIKKLGLRLKVEYGPGPKQGTLTIYADQQSVLVIPFYVNEFTDRFTLEISRPGSTWPIKVGIDRHAWQCLHVRYRNEQILAAMALICSTLRKEQPSG